MNTLMELVDERVTGVLFNISIVVIVYVLAKKLTASGPLALAFSFTPVAMAWAFQNASTRQMVLNLF
jgi:NhaP-type Na+/H+ or K+/H+ antiporter